MLDLYLQLEYLRFENLSYALDVDENLETANILLPSILVQPYIENTLKHGLLHKKTGRKLNISFLKKGQYLECIVEDNGIGRVKSAEIKKIARNTNILLPVPPKNAYTYSITATKRLFSPKL